MIGLLPLCAEDGGISAQRIREQTRFLGSDLMEGRGIGQRGGQLATEYIATQLALAGAKPAGENGTYFQKVPLVGIETQPASDPGGARAGQEPRLRVGRGFRGRPAGRSCRRRSSRPVRCSWATGSRRPEFQWDDFKGVNVAGKVVVLFTNEPPSNDPKFFDGRALTYYGRWTYKYEEALRHGAEGCIIIHTTPTASYGWDVVRNSWGREAPFVKLEPNAPALAFQGWLTREAGEKMLALAGKNLDELLKASERADFRPVDLGIQIRGRMISKICELKRGTWRRCFREAIRS